MRPVVIRGAGEMATGTAHRLHRAGFPIIMSELPRPLAVRRAVSFAQAVFDGSCVVEGVPALRADTLAAAQKICQGGSIAVYVGELRGEELSALAPQALVDAIMAKVNLGTSIGEAPVVIGLGPGFTAGVDVHAVVETQRGHDLGRVLYTGAAQSNTGNPGEVCGYSRERVVKAPRAGVFCSPRQIGEEILAGQEFGSLDGQRITAEVSGTIRGLLMPGTWVPAGTKLGDIDPRGRRDYCYTISDKARAIAGGVLEALLFLSRGNDR